MQLDRRSILRDDFSRVRRGYDPDEVRGHLKQIAEWLEDLEQERQMAPMADSAAAEVRSILQAAERSRTKLESAAQEEADRIREEAERVRAKAEADAERVRDEARAEAERVVVEAQAEADRVRAQASVETAEGIERAHAASKQILERAEAIERQLAAVQADAAALSQAVVPERRAEPGDELHVADAGEEGRRRAGPDRSDAAAVPAADVEDVRLIALNMALNGSPREETAAYLRENFEIEDPEPLLDGVYAEART